jgi:glycosyltransferase involved in cell wall biosynthesis
LAEVAGTRFVFLGDDRPDGRGSTWRQRLQDYFREQQVSENVTFVGWVDEPSLLNWYQEADIAVVPSILYESFSYTCAQASAAGLPVVASRIGGIPDTVEDGVSGVLVTPGDDEQLARALIDLATDQQRRRRMGEAGLVRAKSTFDATLVARQMVNLYADAIRTRKAATQAKR